MWHCMSLKKPFNLKSHSFSIHRVDVEVDKDSEVEKEMVKTKL